MLCKGPKEIAHQSTRDEKMHSKKEGTQKLNPPSARAQPIYKINYMFKLVFEF